MSNFTDFISGSSVTEHKLDFTNPTVGTKVVFTESTTLTPTVDYTAIVTCIGAGGAGREINLPGSTLSGGGAGGVCQSELSLSAGVTYTITIGAGATTNGNAGGNTTFTGSDITDMAANGGEGGDLQSAGVSAVASGGTATGGNIVNRTGGGSVSGTIGDRPTGGGALGFYADGVDGIEDGFAGPGATLTKLPTDLIPELNINITGGFSNSSAESGNAGDGDFGCGGGARRLSTSSAGRSGNGGSGGIGAGGGGAYLYSSTSTVSGSPGTGGNGLLIIQCIA